MSQSNQHQSDIPQVVGLVCAAALLCLHSATVRAAESQPPYSAIPAYIETATMSSYAWVSVEAAVSTDGRPHTDFFRYAPNVVQKLERGLAAREPGGPLDPVNILGADDCSSFPVIAIDYRELGSKQRIQDFVASSRLVFAGRIVAVDQGFSFNTPGTLINVEVEAELRNITNRSLQATVYVFYPYARFSVGAERFCRGPSATTPKAGFEMVVFADVPVTEENVLWVSAEEVVFFDSESERPIYNSALCRPRELSPAGFEQDLCGGSPANLRAVVHGMMSLLGSPSGVASASRNGGGE